MTQPLVNDPDQIRLAMLGMVEGNGHPYSWSAIVNGTYNADAIVDGGYQGIVNYLSAQPADALGIPGTQVTHVWCDDRDDADRVSRAADVANVVDDPEQVIGEVDAVVVATDIGGEHVERARPFIEAGLPVFIDKPLTDREDHLRQFMAWHQEGRPFLSTSAMRYAQEFIGLKGRLEEVGTPRLVHGTMLKTWARYGIHILESVYHLLPPGGWRWVSHSGEGEANIVHAHHEQGVEVVLSVIADLYGGYGAVDVYGKGGHVGTRFTDTFTAFKRQLVAFVDYLRTGRSPVDFAETVEQMKIVIGALQSAEQGGKRIDLDAIAT